MSCGAGNRACNEIDRHLKPQLERLTREVQELTQRLELLERKTKLDTTKLH